MTLGHRIRAARKEAGLTQQALAGSDFTAGFISQLENGVVRPSLRSLAVLARRLNKPLAYFLGEESGVADAQALALAERLLVAERPGDAEAVLAPVIAGLSTPAGREPRPLRLVGTLRLQQGDPAAALALLEEALAQSASAPAEEQVRLHNALARALYELDRLEEACHHLEKGLALLPEVQEDPALRLRLETNYAIVLCRLGRYEECRELGSALLQAGCETGLQYRLAELLHTLGVAYRKSGETERALEYYQAAAALYRLFGDRRLLAGAQTNIGIALAELGRWDESFFAFRAAVAFYAEVGSGADLVNARVELARAALAAEQVKLALTEAEAAWHHCGSSVPAALQAEAAAVLAACREAAGEAEGAARSYAMAVALYGEAGDRAAAARAARDLGRLLGRTGRSEEALPWLERAFTLLAE